MLGLNLSLLTVAIRKALALWSPTALFASGEQGVWYDPSDFSTMFQDSAGTTPVTAVGQPVGRILDKSGRGNHATQATTASRPTLEQDANGKYYLAFDGVGDWMSTAAVDFTATDEIAVFAGVRKLAPTAQMFVELSANVNSNNGSFTVYTGGYNIGGDRWSAVSKGTALLALDDPATSPSPATAVLSLSSDISAPLNTLRANGVQKDQSSGNQGTGNYGNYPLYIGRRGDTSLPLNGRIYQLIIRGALTDAAGITAAETFVNSKTAAY